MEITIFDVAHGFCAYLIADNGNSMLFDCGHNPSTGLRPSDYLTRSGCRVIGRLMVSNYDEDHISDLPELRRRLPINTLYRNTSLSSEDLKRLKLQGGPLGRGMVALLEMISEYTGNVTGTDDLPDVEIAVFYSNYPNFTDTNNLSMVTFVHYQGIHIVFPGDLEEPGWKALLPIPSFQNHLKRVNLYVASHHGRQSGLCPKVFDYCIPDIVIISDESIHYQTQQVDYSKYAKGITWQDGSTRFTLSTRNNGTITISQPPRYAYYIHTSS